MSEKNQKKDKSQEEKADCGQKCQEYLDGWKRALADYDNLKKDLVLEKASSLKYAKISMAKDLLPVIDSFDKAMQFADHDSTDAFVQGIKNICTQFEEVLKKSSIESYGIIGDEFDPHLHEAVAEGQDQDQKDGMIIEVLERGWKCGDSVIRPAKVIVNKIEN